MRVRALSFPNDITPAQITANQNDYNPEGWEAATVLRISSNGNYNITGHVAPQESARGRFLVYRNVNALGGGTLTLPDQSALSAASSRWAFPGGNIDVAPLDGIAFLYDFTALRWFVFGDPVGPAEVGTTPIVVRKSATESVNDSSVLQNDDALLLAVAASEVWAFKFVLFVTSDDVKDFQYDITGPTGATGRYMHVSVSPAEVVDSDYATAIATAISVLFAVGTTARCIEITGEITVSTTAGNLQLRWAQNTADAGNTSVLVDSYLIAHKLA